MEIEPAILWRDTNPLNNMIAVLNNQKFDPYSLPMQIQ